MVDILNPYSVVTPAAKGVRLSDLPPEAWHYLRGGPAASSLAKLHRAVPWLFRGVDLRGDAVADMPFVILSGTGGSAREVDNSRNWQNVVGFLPRPRDLFWLVEAALVIWGYAYLEQGRNVGRRLRELRYLLPTTVKPEIDAVQGLTGFTRVATGKPLQLDVKDVCYFWNPDPFVELGPPESSPAQAALAAAGVLYNVDEFAAAFFARGAIKGTLLTVAGNPPDAEKQRIKSWWQRLFSGITNAWSDAVVSADMVTPVVVGEGLESLERSDLTRSRREDIATALGIPHTMLFSDAANYATAERDTQNFYETTIKPECSFIQETLNEQVFVPQGYRLQFQPESLPIYQENEQERSASLASLRTAGVPLLLAMDLLGYELSDDQRAELERAEAERQARAEEMARRPMVDGDDREDRAADEMRTWRRWALRRVKQGKALRDFDVHTVPKALAGAVAGALEGATTAAEVEQVFDSVWAGYP
ncbi:MAG: Phage portal protein [Chloroflexi bacterium ADurb.Bin222]|nr:MAG: Phage portal protein [Chloroflexi bacterium ADurb.Bin222]